MNGKIPSAITGIKLNRATFSDAQIPELTFINFFYGNNGAGKSSIAHAIEEGDGITWADGKSAADYDVLVYNQDYINRNFLTYGDLKGVFIFGEEDIEAKKRISELTEEKKRKSDERSAALDEHRKKTTGLETGGQGGHGGCHRQKRNGNTWNQVYLHQRDAVHYVAIWAKAQLRQATDRHQPVRRRCYHLHGHRQHKKMGAVGILRAKILRKHCAGNQPGYPLLRHADAPYQPNCGACT